MEQMSNTQVLVTTENIQAFAKTWPGSGMRGLDVCLIFSFDHNGINDIEWLDTDGVTVNEPTGVDEVALSALAQDAKVFLDKARGWSL